MNVIGPKYSDLCGFRTRGQGVQRPHEGRNRDGSGVSEVKEKAKAYQRPQDAERNREDLPRELEQEVWQ